MDLFRFLGIRVRAVLGPIFGTYAFWAPVIALGIVGLLVVGGTDIVARLEYMSVNLRYLARAPFDPPADPRIVYVAIDQYSIDHLGAWPWPRTVEAGFLNLLAENKPPDAVAFDVLFSENYDKVQQFQAANIDFDQKLADAAGELPSVITGAQMNRPVPNAEVEATAEARTKKDLAPPTLTTPYTHIHGDVMLVNGSNVASLPVKPVREQSLFGFINDEPSHIDAIRHTLPIIIRIGDKLYPSLSLQTLCQLLSVDADRVEIDIGHSVTLRNSSGKTWVIPIRPDGEIEINYRSLQTFQRNGLPFYQVNQALYRHTFQNEPLPPECDFSHKAVVIGGEALGLTDLGPTPMEARTPLVYTHLNVINDVLRNDYLHFVPAWCVVFGWLVVSWVTLFGLHKSPVTVVILVPFFVALGYSIIAFLIFALWSVQIILAWPVMAYGLVNFGEIVHRWRQELAGRREMKQLFSRMLSPEVMDHMLDHPANLQLGGSTRAVTILFSDIRDYTGFSENLNNQELVRQLNVYFEEMVECINEEEGTCHKFIGDAIMAVWGDIAATSQGSITDARNAVRAALKMRVRLRQLNEKRVSAGQIQLRIGIGLNHGDVLAGQIGSSRRSEWTVMGDPVNTASRLESMTKTFHTDLAIGESVKDLLGDIFSARRLGLIQLKGKTRPTMVWEVISEKSAPEHEVWTSHLIEVYEGAFDHFLGRRFLEAEAGFRQCLEKIPTDYCASRYM